MAIHPIRKMLEEEELVQLDQLTFFHTFPKDLLDHLKKVTQSVNFEKGESILVQGERNHCLYFLVSGRLEVLVDGGKVAHLDRKGDVLGEMSVITQNPCAASIISETKSSLFRVDAREFEKIPGANSDQVQHTLFRIYSMILSEKLHITNQRAKQLEATSQKLREAKGELLTINEQLEKKVRDRTSALRSKTDDLLNSHQKLEQQNTELIASHKKLEEMYTTRDITFAKLEQLMEFHFKPMKANLQDLEQGLGSDVGSRVKDVILELDGISELLKPLTDLYTVEKSLIEKKVLLVESDRRQQLIARLALGGTGVDLSIVSDINSVPLELESKNIDVMFISSRMLSAMDMAKKISAYTKVVLLTSDPIPQYIDTIIGQEEMPNIVSLDDKDRTFTIKNITTTLAKILGKDIFGIEKYLSFGVEIKELDIKCSLDRQETIQTIIDYYSEMQMRSSNRDRCACVVEEMLMNAIYDAPVNSDGKSKYNHLERTVPVNLERQEWGRIRYATDGVFMAVSVEDPFGELTGNIVLSYLQSCYEGKKEREKRVEKGGAGRGLHQIVENSDLVVFNVSPGKKTEVIALFSVEIKKSAPTIPSFHFFVQK